MRGYFDNSKRLVLFTLRRERLISAVWIVCLVLFSAALANGMEGAFDDVSRQALVLTLNNPAAVAMMGPVYGADNYTVGAMYSNTMLLWIIIAVAVMNIFLVARNTRGDEEKGRAEVTRSLPVGRLSGLNATMVTAVIVNALLAIFVGLAIGVAGGESMGFGGAMLYGAAIGVSGLLFAAISALFSQLSSSSRGAIGYSFLVLAVFYMLRAAGDMRNETLSLISPLGLAQRTQVFVENRWWPLLIILIESIVVAAVAYKLNTARDIDQGIIPARPGRKGASPLLNSPFGLAFRLVRNMLIIWIVAMFLLGAAYGSILGDIGDFVKENEFYQTFLGVNEDYSVVMMFSTMVNSVMALICLVPVLFAALKPLGEEKAGHTEHILARAVKRSNYLFGYTIVAFASAVLFQYATALGLHLAASTVLSNPAELSLHYLLKANLMYLPAIWFIAGLAILLVGLVPRAAGAIWGYFGFCFLMSLTGRVMELPPLLARLNPFDYIPQLPVDEINWITLAIMAAMAVAMTAIGFLGYDRDAVMS